MKMFDEIKANFHKLRHVLSGQSLWNGLAFFFNFDIINLLLLFHSFTFFSTF